MEKERLRVEKPVEKERLQVVLARSGVASRRTSEQFIREGRVTVNGRLGRPGELVDPATDTILVDGKKMRAQPAFTYVLVNKPKGVVTSGDDVRGRPTVRDILPLRIPLFHIGRLDADTTGLLILTNDGDFANKLAHPRYGLDKTYRAAITHSMTDDDLYKLKKGVLVEGRKVRVSRALLIAGKMVELTIHEGRKHVVKKLLRAIGYHVRELSRIRVGPLSLHGLPIGHWRLLNKKEVGMLRAAVEMREKLAGPAHHAR